MALKNKAKEGQYSDKDFNKGDANFVRIELSYKKYRNPLFLESQLN